MKQEVPYKLRQQAGEPWRDCILDLSAHSMNLPTAALFRSIAVPSNWHLCLNLQLENQLHDP